MGTGPSLPASIGSAARSSIPSSGPTRSTTTGKRVVVIGSGATAVTLVPALADRAAHVTMLQRSPSYILSLPAVDPIAGVLERVLPAGLAYKLVRWKNVAVTVGIYELSRYRPATMKRLLRGLIARQLPAGYDVDRHFKPRYDPWDQRMCLVPDGDLFEAISAGRVSVITDQIDSFTETGHRARLGVRARRRHDRHRHRAEDGPVRRHLAERRRKRGSAARRARLSRHAGHRRSEHGVRVRVREPVLDARKRPSLSAGLPDAAPHGRATDTRTARRSARRA